MPGRASRALGTEAGEKSAVIWLRKAFGITAALGIAASVGVLAVGILLDATPVAAWRAMAQAQPQSVLDLTRPIYTVEGAVICNKTLVSLVYSDACPGQHCRC
jgi:hypothetical protein